MNIAFQRILRKAREGFEEWDTDAFERDVRDLAWKLGHELIQAWAEGKAVQAHDQAAYCISDRRRRVQWRD